MKQDKTINDLARDRINSQTQLTKVFKAAADLTGSELYDVLGESRKRNDADARAIGIAYCFEQGVHYKALVNFLGRDHSTLYVAKDKVAANRFINRLLVSLREAMAKKKWKAP